MQAAKVTKRRFLKTAAAAALMPAFSGASRPAFTQQSGPPNVIIIFADDLGSGDLGVYGSAIRTPNLDHMAHEGARFTEFYSANPVCSPSRAALLTGRYPTRVGIPTVLFPADNNGIPESETTIAQMLKMRGYKTMCVGKWHLGSLPEFLPTNRGFDEFYGVPYSNDMQPFPLMHNTMIIEEPAKLETLAQRYTEHAVRFIANSKASPFFLYLAHSMPHIPLAASPQFTGKSAMGPYGDVVEEIDWSTGQILGALADHGLDQNTLVLFSSDHGPWYQGSSGKLQGRKGETYEGGVRVPFIARFPGRIPKRLISQAAGSTMDILPTLARLCNAPLPHNLLDGTDIWPLLTRAQQVVDRGVLLYFDGWHLQCARLGKWKLHVSRYNVPPWGPAPSEGRLNLPLPSPELYNLEADSGECYDISENNPQIVTAILARIATILPSFPEQVRKAWQDTQSIKVEYTPPGALPIRKKP